MDRSLSTQLGALGAGAAALASSLRGFAGELTSHAPARLVKADGTPLRAAEVGTDEAMVFAYPYAGIPCFLINLGAHRVRTDTRKSPDDGDYVNPPGVGPQGNLVAFVAICTHQLTYPNRRLSVLRYAARGSELAGAPCRIVCCAHGSVFDPADGARRVSGPAPAALVPVRLTYDAASDGLSATGTVADKFLQRFFGVYKGELIEDFGPGAYRRSVGAQTRTVTLSEYSKLISAC